MKATIHKINATLAWLLPYPTYGNALASAKFGQIWKPDGSFYDQLNHYLEKHVHGYVLTFWLQKGSTSVDAHNRWNMLVTTSRLSQTLPIDIRYNCYLPMMDHSVTMHGDLVLRLGPVL